MYQSVQPPVVAHLPQSLDLKSLLGRRELARWHDYAAWLVSKVVFRRFVDDGVTGETFVPLSKKACLTAVPQHVRKPLLTFLADEQVLECDNHSFPPLCGRRGKAYCWRVGEPYRRDKIRPHLLTHPELVRKLARDRASVTDLTHCGLRAWVERVEVVPEAPEGFHPLLDALKLGDRRFHVCDQGRVHTPITNLPRQCRQFVRLAGNHLTSVDVSTCQPLLLGLIFAQELNSQQKRRRNDWRKRSNPRGK